MEETANASHDLRDEQEAMATTNQAAGMNPSNNNTESMRDR